MQVAIRPYATAGIALVGASVIAVSPMAPPLPDIHLPNPAHVAKSVELAAEALATTPLTYPQVFQEAVTNLQAILKTVAANPTPILTQVLSNQLATVKALMAVLPTTNVVGTIAALPNAATSLLSGLATSEPAAIQGLLTALQTALGQISTAVTTTAPPLLQAALGDLTKGNVEDAINNVLSAAIATVFPIQPVIQPLLAATITTPLQAVVDAINSIGPLGTIISNPLQNVVNVINAVQEGGVLSPLAGVVTGLLGPALSGAGAFGAAVDNVEKAIGTGNPGAALAAIVNAPATILGGVLNGGFGPNLASLAGLPPDLVTVVAGGLLSGGLSIISTSPQLTVQLAGTINSLQALVQAIAKAIVPPTVTPAVKTSTLGAAAELPAAPAKTVTLKTGSAAAGVPAKTSGTESSSQTDTEAGATDATKPAATPADSGESTGTTKDSTDTSTGNKVEPTSGAGSDAPKSGDSESSTTTHESTTDQSGTTTKSASGESDSGAAKGADKGAAKKAHTPKHAHASK